MKKMIDSHCHLDTFFRDGTLAEIISRAESAGVRQFITAGTNPDDCSIYNKLAQAFPRKIFYAAGLHPTEVSENFEEQLSSIENFFEMTPQPVAVGEIGLDNHWLSKDSEEASHQRSRQRAAFSAQLNWAKTLGLPIIVHARDAFREAVEEIDASGVDWRRIVFHCFSEDAKEIREINARGGRASFTGTLTYKNAENTRRAALEQGLSRLVIETDCPYLAPKKHRGQRNEPAFLRETAEFAAEIFGVSYEELARTTEENAREFFGI